MSDEHRQQAAALLEEAEHVEVSLNTARPREEREEQAQQRRRDLRQEAMVHAVLHVGEKLEQLRATAVAIR